MSIWPEKTHIRLWKNKFPLKTDLFNSIFYNLQIRHLPMNKTNLISKAIEKPFSFIFLPHKIFMFLYWDWWKGCWKKLKRPLKTTKVHLYIFLLSRPLPWCFDCDTHELGMIYYKQTFVNSNDKSKDPDLPLWKDEVYKDEEGIGQDKQDKHQDPLRPAGPL